MPKIHLQPRLAKLANWIPQKTVRLIDVGCDHGKLSAYCLQNNLVETVLATDLRPAPLARAEELLKRVTPGDNWTTHCGYGLDGCVIHPGDCIVIAGMGGLEIRDILSAISPEDRSLPIAFLLHPTRAAEELRRSLSSLSLAITGECLCEEQGRIYPILRVQPAEVVDPLDQVACFWGPCLLADHHAGQPDPLWSRYVIKQRIALMKRARNPRNPLSPADYLLALESEFPV